MGEPALKSDRTNPERHPSVRFWPREEGVPDLSRVCLMEHLRVVHGIRNARFRRFITYAYLQSQERGYTRFYQDAAAKHCGVSVCTIHRWTVAVVELGLFRTRKTDRELQLWPRWEALRLPTLAEEMQEQVREQVQEHSFNRTERLDRQQQRARRAEPAARSKELSRETGEGEGREPPSSSGKSSPALPSSSRLFPEEKNSEALSPEPSGPGLAKVREQAGTLGELVVQRPSAVAVPGRLRAEVLKRWGVGAVRDVDAVLESWEARQHPEAARAAMARIAEDDPVHVSNPGGRFRSYVRFAIAGQLRAPASKRGQHDIMGPLADLYNGAITGLNDHEPAAITQLQYDVGKAVHRACEEMRAVDKPPLLAALDAPGAKLTLAPKVHPPRIANPKTARRYFLPPPE